MNGMMVVLQEQGMENQLRIGFAQIFLEEYCHLFEGCLPFNSRAKNGWFKRETSHGFIHKAVDQAKDTNRF